MLKEDDAEQEYGYAQPRTGVDPATRSLDGGICVGRYDDHDRRSFVARMRRRLVQRGT